MYGEKASNQVSQNTTMKTTLLTLTCLLVCLVSTEQTSPIKLKDGRTVLVQHIESYKQGVLFRDAKSDLLLIPHVDILDNTYKVAGLKKFEPGAKVSKGARTVVTGLILGIASGVLNQLSDGEVNNTVFAIGVGAVASLGITIAGFATIAKNAKYLDVVRW